MSVRYKFKSEANFNQINFNGMEISVEDVKKEIFRQRKLGKSENIDLMISNTNTGEKYLEDSTLIPKNSSLTIIRVPKITTNNNNRNYFNKNNQESQNHSQKLQQIENNSDLTKMNATEEEKIMAMMMQSTADYKNFLYSQNQNSKPPSGYICRKCHISGHFIRNCPFNITKTQRFDPKVRKENKKMTGIPMSMRNFQQPQPEVLKIDVKIFEIPQNLCCSLCKDIYRKPVKTPCCGITFCHECVVKALIESDEYDCPKCQQKYIFPSELQNDEKMKMEIEKIKMEGNKFAVVSV
ncbi:hypothetical protein PVAND_017274 [Polypedilum vanderplanki]|uniref:Uncharacterized protein n=1 Tax=Polypedilum vanderplanki TaxID=319348 RepID=A0A9J6BIL0_POLVA|nr:hypothetical protein PVAND_017274 [Polypedilum vanderplanki]